MKLLLASNNQHKLSELSRILAPLGVDVVTPKQIGINLGDVDENGDTFAENAKIKAENAYKIAKMPVIADDTGLSVDALNGAPGVYTARYAGENATDKDNVIKLLNNMENVDDTERGAHFTTCIYCIIDDNTTISVVGECFGKIAREPQGDEGFGYDPVFICNKFNKTFALCTPEEKDSTSHRGKALRKFADELKKYCNKEKT